MGKTVIVAEKPSVARDIAKVVGANDRQDGYIAGDRYMVTWALGHLVALCEPGEMNPAWQAWDFTKLPMLPDDMAVKVLPRTKKQFGVISKLINHKDADEIICATDSGREGELIFRLIYEQAGCKKPVKRLWISSMTDEAIKEGMNSLRDISHYDSLYMSAKCRSQADWLVGMNASRAFSLKYSLRLSVGRVQTPTLALLVQRAKEIESFVPTVYYEVTADFGDFTGLWYDPAGETTRLADEAAAKAVIARVKGGTAEVEDITTEKKQIPPPQLYDLTALQRDCNAHFGLSAAKTLDIAQSLYEKHKAITYPRTDSRYLPADMRSGARKAIESLTSEYAGLCEPVLKGGELPLLPRVFDDKKVSDHHAIIPTGKRAPGMSGAEKQVFDLIARRLIASFYPAYKYDSTKVVSKCGADRFLSRGMVVSDKGWRAVYIGAPEDKEQLLPVLKVGDQRKIIKLSHKKKSTKPPSPHTEATLLSAMEHAGRDIKDEALKEQMKGFGLGTPATRAAIIERLIEVGFVTRKARSLLPTEKGVRLIEAAPEEMTSPETTGKWERALESIKEGRMDGDKFMASIRRFTEFLVKYTAESAPSREKAGFPEEKRPVKGSALQGVKCPFCQSAVIETGVAFSCRKWRDGCKFAIYKQPRACPGGPEIDRKTARALILTGKAEAGGGVYALNNGYISYSKGEQQ